MTGDIFHLMSLTSAYTMTRYSSNIWKGTYTSVLKLRLCVSYSVRKSKVPTPSIFHTPLQSSNVCFIQCEKIKGTYAKHISYSTPKFKCVFHAV